MTAAPPTPTEAELLELAKHGDRRAFDQLLAPQLPRLRNLVRRMVGDPQDTADLVQDVLVRAYTRIGGFRGESSLATWLYAIATRVAIDFLSTRRLAADAKLRLREHVHVHHRAELEQMWSPDGAAFDAREHIAFCFGCVSRSLPPEDQAALVLRDVLDLSNDEAAKALDVTTSVLRHRLAAARTAMQERYDGLCRLVSKTGVCYQCEGLRESFPDRARGPAVPVIADATPEGALRKRLAVVRDADIETGASRAFHDFLWRALARLADVRESA